MSYKSENHDTIFLRPALDLLHESYISVSMALSFELIERNQDVIADQFFDTALALGHKFPPYCEESKIYTERLYREAGLLFPAY